MINQYFKYFSSVILFVLALCAGWWMWNYYMQSPWTRDGKVRAEIVSITPEVSGRLIQILAHDNQLVSSDSLLFVIDPQPYQLALDNAQTAVARAQIDLAKATHEAERRRNLPKNSISGEDLDIANLTAESMKATYKSAISSLEQAKWNLSKTRIYAPTNGYITNLQTRVGNYATAGIPLVALIDTDSFYVMGYFEETKLRHIREGNKANIVLYDGNIPLQGVVESIGRAIYDQSVDTGGDLLLDVKPNVPWVRLAQRVPVRFKLLDVPADVTLIAGTTCTISVEK